MDKEPLISVVIPVYGVEKYLQQCIDSLMNQTMRGIEYIFVNDASPDNCLSVLKKNESIHPDLIRVIDSKVNMKQGGARNLGIDASKAPYIGFCDSDDYCGPEMFEKLYNAAKLSNSDAAFIQYSSVGPDTVYTPETSRGGVPLIKWDPHLIKAQGHELTDEDKCNLMAYPIGNVCCGLWKKSVMVNNDIRFPEHVFYEDNYWGSILKPYLKSVTFVQEVGYYYRTNPTSTTHLWSAQNEHRDDRIQVEAAILREAKSRGLYEKYKAAYDYGFIFRRSLNTWHLCVNKYDEIDNKFLKGLMTDLKKEIPDWEKNLYYVALTDSKRRLMNEFIVAMPVFMAKVWKASKRIMKKLEPPVFDYDSK